MLALALAACGGDDEKTIDAAPPPPIDAPPFLTLDCNTYCTQIAATCKDANNQFTAANCMATCAAYTPGTQADMAGNTLGCRNYHIQNITVRNMPANPHCWHAGPGGSLLGTATGVCGASACENFCALEAKVCGTDAVQVPGVTNRYATTAACMTACNAFAKTPEYSPTVVSGDNFACRLYHLTNAAANAAPGTNVHCGHTLSPAMGVCI
jgi:hypothetical protein